MIKKIGIIILTLFVFQFGFSQTEKLVKGKVLDKDLPIQGADVINYTTQKSTITNSDGVFYIEAKANDILLFYRKDYIDRKIVLKQKDIAAEIFVVDLAQKSIELKEVVIDNRPSNEFKVSRADIANWKVSKDQGKAKVEGINDGSIPNGLNIFALGEAAAKGIKKLFKSDHKVQSKVSEAKLKNAFKQYVTANIEPDYFTKGLKLQTNEIPRFLDFCDVDTKSKTIVADKNILSVMDFLIVKNTEFQKTKVIEKVN